MKDDVSLRDCLPEYRESALVPGDIQSAAELLADKHEQFVISENLQGGTSGTEINVKKKRRIDAVVLALDALRKWQSCYGKFSVPSVLVESLCKAELVDVAMKLFGYSIPAQEVVASGANEAANAIDSRALDGLVTEAQYIDMIDHMSFMFAPNWRPFGRALKMDDRRLDHYERVIPSGTEIVHKIVREWYRQHGVHCTLTRLVDACERVQPDCRVELLSKLPKIVAGFTSLEPLVLAEEVMEERVCCLAIEIVSSNACGRDKWRSLARRLGVYNTEEYEDRYSLLSDVLYEILIDWMKRAGRDATLGRLLDACQAVYVRGVVEYELKIALDSKIRGCGKKTCRLCNSPRV